MQQRRPQAWRTRPAHRQAHRRPTARDPAAAATSANLPQKAAHTATGGASGRNRSRSPGMGPDVGLRALAADRTGGTGRRRPDARRHATLPQSWIQRENWEFETHRALDRSEQIEGGGRIITRRLGQRVDTDHA